MTRDARAWVDLGALRHNLAVVRRSAPGRRILAVVKADGYGHGLLPVAHALSGADGFAVTSLQEAIPLREAGLLHPIVLLQGLFGPDELSAVERYRLDIVVHSLWQIEMLEQARSERPLVVWLKVDSGMHRLGLSPEEVPDAYRRLQRTSAVGEIRFLTHLAAADDRNSEYTRFQLAEFARATDGLSGVCSIANSAGILGWPDSHGDWVRPGIMLYGATPFVDGRQSSADLRPVMTLTSRLVAVYSRKRGDRVGYAGTFECPEDMPVGVVAVGYGDGYPRHAGTGTPILVDGHRTQILGRVSMDIMSVDLRPIPNVQTHAPVTLWGRGLPVEEVAAHSGTIPYELLCKISQRVHIEYEDDDGEGTSRL